MGDAQIHVPAGSGNDPAGRERKFKELRGLTPRVSLQYVVSPQLNFYTSYSKGQKIGLFNTTGGNAAGMARPISTLPEKLDAYEIKFKSDITRWLRLNGTSYLYKSQDLHVTIRNATNIATRGNAGRATIYDGELELAASPTRDLQSRGSIAYVHSRLDSYPGVTITLPIYGVNGAAICDVDCPAAPGGPYDLLGNSPVRSPRFTFNLGADYDHDFDFWRAGVGANLYNMSKIYFDFQTGRSSRAIPCSTGKCGSSRSRIASVSLG